MIHIIIRFLLMGLAVAAAAYLLPGVEVAGFGIAVVVAIVIALLNATVGWLLRVLTLPVNILTLGLMGFVITILMILLADNLIEGFVVGGFINAALFAVILALIGMLFDKAEVA